MLFRLMSDLHNEFATYNYIKLPTDKETCAIFAGDIDVGLDARRFLFRACQDFRKVVYVLGNHEFYHNEYHDVREGWRRIAAVDMPGNFVLLDDTVHVHDKIRLIGGTLWTDMNRGDWFAKQACYNGMNDYEVGRFRHEVHGIRALHPDDTIRAHMITRTFITEELRKPWDGKTIVVTHHLPHPLCVNEIHKFSPLNPGYMVNMDEVIEQFDIDVWCHGHTHIPVDVTVHNTRILCNPRGYTHYGEHKDFNPTLTFEL